MNIFTWLKRKKINCSESQNVAYEEDDVCPDYGGNGSSRNDNHYSADNGLNMLIMKGMKLAVDVAMEQKNIIDVNIKY